MHFVGVAGFFPKGKEAFCIYTVQFLGEKASSFPHFCGFPLFLCFASTMVVPFVGFTLLLSLCYGFVPFVMGLCSAFFVFLCLFFSVSGEYCYSVLLFLCSGSLFLCFVCFSLCSVPLFYVFLLFVFRFFCFLLFIFRCFYVLLSFLFEFVTLTPSFLFFVVWFPMFFCFSD